MFENLFNLPPGACIDENHHTPAPATVASERPSFPETVGMSELEFFFDFSSPWTYMAFHNIQPIVAETRAEIFWRPFLVGGVFNAVNQGVYALRQNLDDVKFRHAYHWLQEWAALAGLPMNFPSPYHPLKSVLQMRVCCALEEDQQALLTFSTAAFHAYFAEAQNLDDADVVKAVADDCGLDGEQLLRVAAEQTTKDRLRSNTDEAIARGAFGSPTMFVNGEHLYFGNDQLPLVRQALAGPAS